MLPSEEAKNTSALQLFQGKNALQLFQGGKTLTKDNVHVLKYNRIQCAPKLHYMLQSNVVRYDFLLRSVS